jgi:anti-sigma B factor antagonist
VCPGCSQRGSTLSLVLVPRVIHLDGELDLASVSSLRSVLGAASEDEGSGLILDLSDVSFIDSTGLGAIIEADALVHRHGGRLAVIAPRGTAASELLTLTGLRRRLSVYETRSAALDVQV